MPVLTLNTMRQKYLNTINRIPPPHMGFSLFGSTTPADAGATILQAYFNAASQFSTFEYPDYGSWMDYINVDLNQGPDFASDVGNLVLNNSASTTIGQATDRVVALANSSSGDASPSDIIGTAGGVGSSYSPNILAAIPAVATSTATQIATGAVTGAEAVGNLAINTAKGAVSTVNILASLMNYLPIILVGAGALYLYSMRKEVGIVNRVLGGSKKNPRRKRH